MTHCLLKKVRWLIPCLVFLLFWEQKLSAQVADHIVISEIFGGGGNSGATLKRDFIELYNPTESAVSLAGWTVQYASTSGSSWQSTILTGSIPPRGYFLIGQASGTGGTVDLPTPDVSGSILMSGTGAKIALCNNSTALSGTTPSSTAIVDLVGWGSAGFAEGTAAPATSNTTSIERKANSSSTAASLATGIDALAGNGYDTDDNGANFVAQTTINPQNSSAAAEPETPSTDPSITVNPGSINFGDEMVNTNSAVESFAVTYANLNATSVTITTSAPFSISKTNGGVYSQSLTYLASELNGTTFTVYTVVNASSAGIASGTVNFTGGGDVTPPNVTLTANIIDPSVVVPIHTIQGSGAVATAGTYTIRGIVTAVYPTWSPAGYYIQEQVPDANPNTSEGIFVIQNNPTVSVGNLVQLSGSVVENSATPSFGQAIMTPSATSVISASNPLPAPATFTLPVSTATDFEKYEGMLVQYAGTLTVTDNYELGSFGSIRLSQGGLVYQPTQVVDPNDATPSGTTSTGSGNVSAVTALFNANNNRSIILDDGSSVTPTSLPFVNAESTLRIGSTIGTMSGIMGYGFSTYRIQQLPASHPYATPTNFTYAARPTAVPGFGTSASIRIASFNVLNYFNGNGAGGGFPTSRGAYSLAEFNRQRTKIISALSQINADVVGLLEIESDGAGTTSALADLVNGLNAVLGDGTYAFVNDATVPNTDAIRCAIIYKPAVVTPIGAVMTSSNTVFDRPPVAQNFRLVSAGARTAAANEFNYIINHFKSKGCGSSTGADADQFDGQSCYNERRKLQAQALLDFVTDVVINQSGNDRIISMGDYNAYFEEDPLDVLRADGYQVLSSSSTYSYLFSGQVGSLDHAVVSPAFAPAVAAISKWNINSLEPTYLSYKDGVDDGGDDVVNPWAATYTADQWRSSDHDAVLVGIDFSKALPVDLVSFSVVPEKNHVRLNWSTASETNNKYFTIERSMNGIIFENIAQLDAAGDSKQLKNYNYLDTNPLIGTSYYRLRQTDYDGTNSTSRIVPVKFITENASEFTVYPNPVKSYIKLDLKNVNKDKEILNYKIMNESGIIILTGSGTLVNINKEVNARLPHITTGLYLIRITNQQTEYVFRFLKE